MQFKTFITFFAVSPLLVFGYPTVQDTSAATVAVAERFEGSLSGLALEERQRKPKKCDAASSSSGSSGTLTFKPTPTKGGSKTTYKVDVAQARGQLPSIRMPTKTPIKYTPKSGYPHEFHNGERLRFSEPACMQSNAVLQEYPVFWTASKQKVWQQDTKVRDQDKTPFRMVFTVLNDCKVYCGIMSHKVVSVDHQGSKDMVLLG